MSEPTVQGMTPSPGVEPVKLLMWVEPSDPQHTRVLLVTPQGQQGTVASDLGQHLLAVIAGMVNESAGSEVELVKGKVH